MLDFKGVEDLLDSEQIDLLIVDRNLPSGDSLDRIKELRKQGYKEAVIFLTAKTLHQDLLEGFGVAAMIICANLLILMNCYFVLKLF